MQVRQLLTRTAGTLGVAAGLLFVGSPLMAQVKIGDNPNSINPNSILELESTTKGLLTPRIQLQGTNVVAPMTAPVPTGMRVFNTATTSGDFAVSPGEYYYDGANWVRLISEVAAGVEVYREGAPTVGGSCGSDPEGTIWNDVSEDATGQQWICRSGVWAVYDAPTARTPFNFKRITDGKEVDAGARKSGDVYHYGAITSRLTAEGGYTKLMPGGNIKMMRALALAPINGPFIDFGRNVANPNLFRIGLRNDLNAGNGALVISTNSGLPGIDEKLVVGINGQIGMGTTNPLQNLHIVGDVLIGNNSSDGSGYWNASDPQEGILLAYDPSTQQATANIQSENANLNLTKKTSGAGKVYANFKVGATAWGQVRINATNDDIVYGIRSDRRLKENIKETHYTIDDLMKVEVVDYTFKGSSVKTTSTGFIAQDLYKIYPNAVAKGGDDVKTSPWAVDYGKITPLLVKAVQDQQKEIAALKAQLSEMNALKAEVASIKAMLGNAAQQNSEATISK